MPDTSQPTPDPTGPTDPTPTDPMPTDPTPARSPLTAEQLLSRMAELISTRRRIGDIDVAAVRTLAPDVDQGGTALRHVARLTPPWRYLVQFEPDEPIGPMLQLEFFDDQGGVDAPLTAIAQLDLDQFSERLRAAGFAEQEISDELGASRGRDFTAGELRVTVASIGEADASPDQVSHRCIRSVTVR